MRTGVCANDWVRGDSHLGYAKKRMLRKYKRSVNKYQDDKKRKFRAPESLKLRG